MISRRSLAVLATSTRLLLRDPAPMVVTIVMPLVLAAFLVPAAKAQLHASGYTAANGSEQIIPGVAVMFAFFVTQLIGILFFREHAWGTWNRLRVSSASSADIVLGKIVPLYVVQLLQLGALFSVGWLIFGYRPNGSILALGVVVAVLAAVLATFGVMLVAVFTTMDTALILGSLGGMVMAGLGGALAPVSLLPQWAQILAHASPAYWALEAMRAITLDHADLTTVTPHLGVLVAFGAGFAAITAWRLRLGVEKEATT